MSHNQSEAGTLLSGLSHVLRAPCNEKALFVLLVSGLLTMVLVFLGHTLPGSGSFGPFNFLILFVWLAGISIAGPLLMDQACGQTPRPLNKAISDSILAFLRIFGIALLGATLAVIFYLILVLLFFACKLPVVGPILYAVFLPMLAVLASLLFLGLMAGLAMVCPAIWSGATIREALEMLRQIVTSHAMELLTNLLLLTIFIVLVEFILISIFFASSQFVLGTSAFVLGDLPSVAHPGLTGSPSALLGSADNYQTAIIFGFATGLTLCLAVTMTMALMGVNLIYLRITKNLPLPRAQAYALNLAFQGKDKKEPMIQHIPQTTATGNMGGMSNMDSNPVSNTPDILASLLSKTPPAATMPENAKTTQICPNCHTSAQSGDRFCGECGGSLQG